MERPTLKIDHAKAQRRKGGAVLLGDFAPLRESRLLVGVSGGADSVALLDALVQLGCRPHVCHFNHQWRGAASDGDAEFVRQLAGKYALPITIGRGVVVGAASSPQLGRAGRGGDAAPTSTMAKKSEDLARRARLAFFERVAAKTGIHTIALAHTADDQVETFLLRLIRGAGVTGLAGIWPERRLGKLRVIRPLLQISRGEVIDYLNKRGLPWREDASNADRRFLRNRVRHELLPLLERNYNPRIRDALRRTAEVLRAEAEGDPVAGERRVIRAMSFDQVEALRKLARKAEVPLPVAGEWKLKVPGKTRIGELGVRFVVETVAGRGGDAAPTEEVFDAEALGGGLFVRTWREGDRFQPLGMKGEKKLQDFFVDEKVPRGERGRVPLLCAADGRITWVVGYRLSEEFKVTAKTKRVLRIRFQGC